MNNGIHFNNDEIELIIEDVGFARSTTNNPALRDKRAFIIEKLNKLK